MKREQIRNLTLCAMFAAVITVMSVITIPIGPVPVSMGIFAVMLTGLALGPQRAVIAVSVYLLLGIAGLPVFAGFRGGLAVITGPTGGYLTSYIVVVLLISVLTKSQPAGKVRGIIKNTAACLAGLVICYILGTLQFIYVTNTSFLSGLAVCVFPFIPFDIIKALAAASIAGRLRKGNLLA